MRKTFVLWRRSAAILSHAEIGKRLKPTGGRTLPEVGEEKVGHPTRVSCEPPQGMDPPVSEAFKQGGGAGAARHRLSAQWGRSESRFARGI